MKRIALIKAHLTHRRSKSDSQIENWRTSCISATSDEELFDDPNKDFNGDLSRPLSLQETPKRNSLPFLGSLSGSLRRKQKSPTSDAAQLTPEKDDDNGIENSGLHIRVSPSPEYEEVKDEIVQAFALAASEEIPTPDVDLSDGHEKLDAFGATEWVKFEETTEEEKVAEFVDIPLEDDVKVPNTSQKLMQNLKKIPLRFKENNKYKSMESEHLEVWGSDDNMQNFMASRSVSLPTTTSLKNKLFSNTRR